MPYSPGGFADHGSLGGLADDDHTAYARLGALKARNSGTTEFEALDTDILNGAVLVRLKAANTSAQNRAAWDAAWAAGKHLILPPGTFDIDMAGWSPAAVGSIRGAGRGITILRPKNVGAANPAINLYNVQGFTLADFTLQGAESAVADEGHGIQIRGGPLVSDSSSRIAFHCVGVLGFKTTGKAGIYLDNCFNIDFTDCWVEQCYNGIETVAVTGNANVNAVRFKGGGINDHVNLGVKRGPGFQFALVDCDIEGNDGGGIDVAPAAVAGVFDSFHVRRVYMEANGPFHIRAGQGSTQVVRNITVDGCFLNGDLDNVLFDNVRGGRVVGNRHNVGGAGTYAFKTTVNTTLCRFDWDESDSARVSIANLAQVMRLHGTSLGVEEITLRDWDIVRQAANLARIRTGDHLEFEAGDLRFLRSTDGIILKDGAATPHYWRVTVDSAGALVTTDLGTSLPSTG